MKKILLFTLTLSLLASCSQQTETTVPSTNDTVVTNPDVTPDVTPDSTPEEEPDEGIQGPPSSDNPLSSAYAKAIYDVRDDEMNQYNPILVSDEDEFSEYIFPLLNFQSENAEGYAIAVSAMMVQAYGIAAVMPVEGQEEEVMAGLQHFIDSQIQNFTGYLADQLEVAQSARLETLENGVILMVMCDDQDTVFDTVATEILNA